MSTNKLNKIIGIATVITLLFVAALFSWQQFYHNPQVSHDKNATQLYRSQIIIISAARYMGNISTPEEAKDAMARFEADKKRWVKNGYIVLDAASVIAAPDYLYMNKNDQ